MARMKFDYDGFNQYIRRLQELGSDVRSITDEVLVAAFNVVTPKAREAMEKPFLPAQGKYSSGRTLESLREVPEVLWQGDTAEVKVGFDIKNGGLSSIFLMYGTPKMPKDQRLYDAFYGNKTQKEVRKAQEDVFFEHIHKDMGL